MNRSNGIVTLTLVAFAGLFPARSPGQEARVGEVRTRQVISVSLSAASTEKEAKRVVYAPPPGWYIRSHFVSCTSKTGNSSYAVNTVPADWVSSSDEAVTESGRTKLAAGAQAHAAQAGTHAASESDRTLTEHHDRSNSHHALIVDVTAKGAGFLRGGGGIDLTVTAEMVYVGR